MHPFRQPPRDTTPTRHIQVTPKMSLRVDYIERVEFHPPRVVCTDGSTVALTIDQANDLARILHEGE